MLVSAEMYRNRTAASMMQFTLWRGQGISRGAERSHSLGLFPLEAHGLEAFEGAPWQAQARLLRLGVGRAATARRSRGLSVLRLLHCQQATVSKILAARLAWACSHFFMGN